jgi:hypothetical protein
VPEPPGKVFLGAVVFLQTLQVAGVVAQDKLVQLGDQPRAKVVMAAMVLVHTALGRQRLAQAQVAFLPAVEVAVLVALHL